jgi:hypothetical protein
MFYLKQEEINNHKKVILIMSKDPNEEKRFVLVSKEEHAAIQANTLANNNLREGIEKDRPNIIKRAQEDVQIEVKEGIKDEYTLTANILTKAGYLYNQASRNLEKYNGKGAGMEGIEQYMTAHLEPYLNSLEAQIGDKGANKQIIQAFKDNIQELTKNGRTLYNSIGNEIQDLRKVDTKITSGWKIVADLLGDNKLGNFFKDLHEKSVQKGVDKLAGKLVDQNLDLKKISGALKDAGMSHGKQGSHAPVRSQGHQQDQNQARGK